MVKNKATTTRTNFDLNITSEALSLLHTDKNVYKNSYKLRNSKSINFSAVFENST